jgi:hypothetical protein
MVVPKKKIETRKMFDGSSLPPPNDRSCDDREKTGFMPNDRSPHFEAPARPSHHPNQTKGSVIT